MILPVKSKSCAKKKLTSVERATITAYLKAGLDPEAIVRQTDASLRTVYRVKESIRNEHISNRKAAPTKKTVGRPKKTTAEMDNWLIENADSNRKLLPKQLQKMLLDKYGVHLSLTRIRFRLRMAGLFGYVCCRKPLLSMINKIKRLHWAFCHRNWTVEDWMRVLWSDEKKFELFNSKRRTYCRRRKNEPLRDDTIQGTVKHGGGSAMFWGCFGGLSLGDIHQVQGIMKKEEYHQILVKHAVPSGLRLLGNGWVFQQDNDPKHKSKLCNAYLRRKEDSGHLKLMIWPPQSPDLSPIELLWDEVDRQVQERKPTSVEALVRIVKSTWKEIAEDVLEKLLKRMPLLCQAVINAGGGYFSEKLSAEKKKLLVYH